VLLSLRVSNYKTFLRGVALFLSLAPAMMINSGAVPLPWGLAGSIAPFSGVTPSSDALVRVCGVERIQGNHLVIGQERQIGVPVGSADLLDLIGGICHRKQATDRSDGVHIYVIVCLNFSKPLPPLRCSQGEAKKLMYLSVGSNL